MTKQEAIFAMIRGEKVTHRYFTSDEYIYMNRQEIYSEDGVNHGVTFWHYRQGEEWKKDWQIYIG